MKELPSVPYGYCHCGCGQKTRIAGHTIGLSKKGEPSKFLPGHNHRLWPKRTFKEDHPGWKGEEAGKGAKNMRARKWFEISGMCERCGEKPACDRHHKDGNPGNNERSNIAFLCRRCHMIVDGRLEQLRETQRKNSQPKPPKLCVICGKPSKPLSHGRCINCAAYFRRRGIERPIPQPKPAFNVEQMYADYQSGLTLEQVGKKYGCSMTAVFSKFEKAGLPRRSAAHRKQQIEKGQR